MKRLSEAEFRNKITWMTFILSCLVVMIHSYNADLFINGEGTGVFAESVKQVQALVSLAVPSIAVPGFFIISSYLFFRDVSWGEIPDKMTRRVRSVLIPYIVWNTLYYFLFIVVSRIPVDVYKRQAGWRIDYFCVSKALEDRLESAMIHTEIMGSDHCPVELVIR